MTAAHFVEAVQALHSAQSLLSSSKVFRSCFKVHWSWNRFTSILFPSSRWSLLNFKLLVDVLCCTQQILIENCDTFLMRDTLYFRQVHLLHYYYNLKNIISRWLRYLFCLILINLSQILLISQIASRLSLAGLERCGHK